MNQRDQQSKTKSGQMKQNFLDLLDHSTFHGFPKIFLSKNILSKTFWLIASLSSFCCCAYLVTNSILDYRKFEVVTRYGSIYENRPPFPLVFFCDHDKKKIECTFNKEKCPTIQKSLTQQCETFNPGFDYDTKAQLSPLESKEYGSGSGLQLQLYTKNESTSISVYISNQSNLILTDPRYISPGLKTTFVIKRIFESRLPAPYSDCRINVTGSKKLDEMNRVYYQSECLEYCKYHLIAEKCNLLDKFLEFSYLYYSYFDDKFDTHFKSTVEDKCDRSVYNKTVNHYNKIGKNEACKQICPVECNSYTLSFSSFYEKLPDSYPRNYVELNVFYDTFDYTIISQTPKVTPDVVLGTIGGLFGLFLGASLLTFGEIFDLFLSVIKILVLSKSVTVNSGTLHTSHFHKNDKNLKRRRTIYKINPSMVSRIQRHGYLKSLYRESLYRDSFYIETVED